MILAHKIALDPTVKQRRYFAQASGCARFTWNLALAEWNRLYAAGEKPKCAKIKKAFNAFKYDAFPWLDGIHRDAHAQPFANLQKAWSKYFKKLKEWKKKGKAEKGRRAGKPNQHLSKKRDALALGQPQFHRKGRKESFYVANDKLELKCGELVKAGRGQCRGQSYVKLPVIGWVRLCEALRFKGRIMGATASRHGQRWFISIQVDVRKSGLERTGDGVAGVDLGVKTTATVSRVDRPGGVASIEKLDAPKPLKAALKKLRRLNKSLARRERGGRNWKRMSNRIGKLHARIKDVRNDFWHKITTQLCGENQTIGIESLNVAGMVRNHRLSRAISDVGFYLPKQQLKYKSKRYKTKLAAADRYYASSKTCSKCGCVKEFLSLSERVFHCDHCGHTQDRDDNASDNLRMLAERKYSRLARNSRLGRVRLVKRLVEPGTKPCSLVGTN